MFKFIAIAVLAAVSFNASAAGEAKCFRETNPVIQIFKPAGETKYTFNEVKVPNTDGESVKVITVASVSYDGIRCNLTSAVEVELPKKEPTIMDNLRDMKDSTVSSIKESSEAAGEAIKEGATKSSEVAKGYLNKAKSFVKEVPL